MNIKLHDDQEIVTDKVVFKTILGRPMIGYVRPGKKKPTYFCVEEVKWILGDSADMKVIKKGATK